jgi:hypothetical protein
MNWSFNVFPLLRPALNNVYEKIAGKDQPLMKIWVNNAVRSDLTWATHHLRDSLGIRLLSSCTWNAEDADELVYCDACMSGLAFWSPARRQGSYSTVPAYTARDIIFYFEALAVASAISTLCDTAISGSKIVVYTDSMNTVDIFHSLRCRSEFNPLLRHCVDIFLHKQFDVRVLHIPGEKNVIADAISRREFNKALNLVPGLHITTFQPPQFEPLGATQK